MCVCVCVRLPACVCLCVCVNLFASTTVCLRMQIFLWFKYTCTHNKYFLSILKQVVIGHTPTERVNPTTPCLAAEYMGPDGTGRIPAT